MTRGVANHSTLIAMSMTNVLIVILPLVGKWDVSAPEETDFQLGWVCVEYYLERVYILKTLNYSLAGW